MKHNDQHRKHDRQERRDAAAHSERLDENRARDKTEDLIIMATKNYTREKGTIRMGSLDAGKAIQLLRQRYGVVIIDGDKGTLHFEVDENAEKKTD